MRANRSIRGIAGVDAMNSIALTSLLPQRLQELRAQQPRICARFSFDLIQETELPRTPRRYRVGLLVGCVQDVAYSVL